MRFAILISCLLALAACDVPSPAGPSADEVAVEEAALESGASVIEAAEAGDEVARQQSPLATLFRRKESEASAEGTDTDENAADGVETQEKPKGLAALFAPKQDAADEPEGPPRQVGLVGGRITVAGPPGYCIDEDSVSDGRRAAFVILASCNILSDGEFGPFVQPAIMTVSVDAPGSGKTIPSASEIAATVGSRMIGGKDLGTFTMALLQTGGDQLLESGDQRHWRGAFAYRNRLIGLALYAPHNSPLLYSDAGADLLADLRVGIENASR